MGFDRYRSTLDLSNMVSIWASREGHIALDPFWCCDIIRCPSARLDFGGNL